MLHSWKIRPAKIILLLDSYRQWFKWKHETEIRKGHNLEILFLLNYYSPSREQVFKLLTWGRTMYFHNYVWPGFVILASFVFRFYFCCCRFFFFFFLIKRRKRNEILSNSLSADPIKWLFSQFYNCNLIKHNYLHYQYVKFIGKNKNKKQVRKKRFYTSALSCLRISILARDSGRSSQRRTAHGHWPAVNLKEGMSNLFLFPIFRECASPLFLNLLQRRGGASLLTYFK